jgi:hypothetical protein
MSTFLSDSSSSEEDSDRFKSDLWCKTVERNCAKLFEGSFDFGFFPAADFEVSFFSKFSFFILASLDAGLGFFGVGTSVGIFFFDVPTNFGFDVPTVFDVPIVFDVPTVFDVITLLDVVTLFGFVFFRTFLLRLSSSSSASIWSESTSDLKKKIIIYKWVALKRARLNFFSLNK